MIAIRLGSRELALIIASLRLWQRTAYDHGQHEHALATNGGDFPALDTAEIDTLCATLNEAEASSANVWEDDPAYPSADWLYEVTNGDTRLGYLDWVAGKKEAAADGHGADAGC